MIKTSAFNYPLKLKFKSAITADLRVSGVRNEGKSNRIANKLSIPINFYALKFTLVNYENYISLRMNQT